jgi:hypothetical protein
LPLSAQPELWQPYTDARTQVLQAAKPVAALKKRFPDRSGDIDKALARAGQPAEKALYLPLIARRSFWTALIDPATADIIGLIPLDPY